MWLAMILFNSPVNAAVVSYPAQLLPSQGISHLDVTGVRGRVQLTGRKGRTYQLKVRHSSKQTEDWNLSVERKGTRLVLQVENIGVDSVWRRLLQKDNWPEFEIELIGPSIPTTVGWRDGQIHVQNWQAPLEISLLKGHVSLRKGRGPLKVQVVSGELRIAQHNGDIEVRGDQGRVRLEQLEGNARVHWLNGNIWGRSLIGNLHLESNQGDVQLREGRGDWHLNVRAGQVQIEQQAGSLLGDGDSSQWNVRLKALSNVRLTSKSGAVHVQQSGLPNSHAKVFLSSLNGPLRSPYRITETDGIRVSQGGEGRQRIYVATGSGAITYKY